MEQYILYTDYVLNQIQEMAAPEKGEKAEKY